MTGDGRLAVVTGATGFVGGHLASALLDRGWRVRALVRPGADDSRLPGRIERAQGDVTEPATLGAALAGADTVFHAACAVADTFVAGRGAYASLRRVNVEGTLHVARAAARAAVRRFVHVSSTAAMGTPPDLVSDERTPCYPTTPYQRTKREAELALLSLHRTDGLRLRIARPCLVLGEGKRRGEILSMYRLARRGAFPLVGNAARREKPLVMVDDLVSALLCCADGGRDGAIYLVAADRSFLLGEILDVVRRQLGVRRAGVRVPALAARLAATACERAARVWGFDPPVTHARLDLFEAARVLDVSRAKSELGWTPRFSDLDLMLGRVHSWLVGEGLL